MAGLAEVRNIEARLTPLGRDWVLAARRDIFFDTDKKSWRRNFTDMPDPGSDPASPYLPDLSLVDRRFFVGLALDNRADGASC